MITYLQDIEKNEVLMDNVHSIEIYSECDVNLVYTGAKEFEVQLTGSEKEINILNYELEKRIENGVLNIELKKKVEKCICDEVVLNVLVPTSLEFLEVKITSGDLNVNNIFAKTAKLVVDCGDLSISGGNYEALECSLNKGDADIFGLGGKIKLTTVQGDITLNEILSEVTYLSAENGDIDVYGNINELSCKTDKGDIEVCDLLDNYLLVAESKNGNISVCDGVLKNVYIKTTKGDISVDYCMFRRLKAESEYGDIDVKMEDVGYCINAETAQGDIDIKCDYHSGNEYVYAGGELGVHAVTKNGDITIK